jgi:hypothetical protein
MAHRLHPLALFAKGDDAQEATGLVERVAYIANPLLSDRVGISRKRVYEAL